MNRIILTIFGLLLIQNLLGQTYHPFPTDTAQWNCVLETNWDPNIHYYYNSHYRIQGNIILDSVLYSKVYYFDDIGSQYIGGLREDTNRNIFFYPINAVLPNWPGSEFPNNTEEHLLYSFDSLTTGMILPINPDQTIQVGIIDSILVGNSYRKRYGIYQSWLSGYDYWIEGIGSSKDLFAPYSQEGEYNLYTLCFTDSTTYYINSPGGPTCVYPPPVGVTNHESNDILIYPNPVDRELNIEFSIKEQFEFVNIYDISGNHIQKENVGNNLIQIKIDNINSGIYLIELVSENERIFRKFIKK